MVALDQRPDGLRLVELARILEIGTSTAQRVLEMLVADGYVEAQAERRPRYRLRSEHPAGPALVTFAHRALPIERCIDLICRANESVEFAGRDSEGYLVVIRRLAEPSDEARFNQAVAAVNVGRSDAHPMVLFRHEDIRRMPEPDLRLKSRARRMSVVKGLPDRSFPGGSGQSRRGRPLRGLHPSLRVPSSRAIAAMAKRHGLARIVIFGSAVRTDFRRDSDVDVLIEPERGGRLGFDDVVAIRAQLEATFDRDVDLVNAGFVRPRVVAEAGSEGVVLYG